MKLKDTIELINFAIKLDNIQKAADHIGVSRSVASKAIKKFERDLGIEFFDRSDNKVSSCLLYTSDAADD